MLVWLAVVTSVTSLDVHVETSRATVSETMQQQAQVVMGAVVVWGGCVARSRDEGHCPPVPRERLRAQIASSTFSIRKDGSGSTSSSAAAARTTQAV